MCIFFGDTLYTSDSVLCMMLLQSNSSELFIKATQKLQVTECQLAVQIDSCFVQAFEVKL